MPFLAQYTIRSKQAYIFRTNRMKEISGASKLIDEAWDLLFDSAGKAGLRVLRLSGSGENDAFPHDPADAFADGVNMIDLFRGGGNDTVMFDCRDSFIKANRAFTFRLIRECPGMVPLAAGVETGLNYREDYSRLMDALDTEKNRMQVCPSCAMLPYSQMDRSTFSPVSKIYNGEQLSQEAYAKRRCYDAGLWSAGAEALDDEPLLAVIHADGNNMGVKIQALLGDRSDYNECIPLMRAFTRGTAAVFDRGDVPFPKGSALRWVINSGDDATILCEAGVAEEVAEIYLRSIMEKADPNSGFKYSACAGICIFHNGFPFSEAYKIAEDACSSAKRSVHSKSEGIREESWIDFHYIHNGASSDLEGIRSAQGTQDLIARPFRVDGSAVFTADKMRALRSLFESAGVTRTNIKTLGAEWETNRGGGKAELSRVSFRAPGLREKLLKIFENEDDAMKAVYDLAETYDLGWFDQMKGGGQNA